MSFSDPLPTDQEINAFYQDTSLYLNVYGTSAQPWQRDQHQLDLLRVEKTRGGKRGRLLDVGASYGLLAEVALELGWDAYGVEPDSVAVEAARKLVGSDRIFQGFLKDVPDNRGPFDVISMSHVWEHFTDFRAALRQSARLLTQGGCLSIQAPNRRALTLWRDGVDYRPIEHPYYWTYRALFRVLRQENFSPRVAPSMWHGAARRGAGQIAKELALGIESMFCPLFLWGMKSTLEVHALKK